jgi:hypothetical protein
MEEFEWVDQEQNLSHEPSSLLDLMYGQKNYRFHLIILELNETINVFIDNFILKVTLSNIC